MEDASKNKNKQNKNQIKKQSKSKQTNKHSLHRDFLILQTQTTRVFSFKPVHVDSPLRTCSEGQCIGALFSWKNTPLPFSSLSFF